MEIGRQSGEVLKTWSRFHVLSAFSIGGMSRRNTKKQLLGIQTTFSVNNRRGTLILTSL